MKSESGFVVGQEWVVGGTGAGRDKERLIPQGLGMEFRSKMA